MKFLPIRLMLMALVILLFTFLLSARPMAADPAKLDDSGGLWTNLGMAYTAGGTCSGKQPGVGTYGDVLSPIGIIRGKPGFTLTYDWIKSLPFRAIAIDKNGEITVGKIISGGGPLSTGQNTQSAMQATFIFPKWQLTDIVKIEVQCRVSQQSKLK